MSEQKWTPGPWCQSDADEYAIFADNGSAIANVLTGADFPCLDDGDQESIIPECEANARLIAQAPALLEALEATLNPDFDAEKALDMAEAAIAAAKGEAK